MVANSSYKVDNSANSVESERSYGQPSSSESSANISQNLLLTDFDSYATSNSVSSYPSSVLQNDSLDCNSNTLQTPMPRCSICKAESTGIHFGAEACSACAGNYLEGGQAWQLDRIKNPTGFFAFWSRFFPVWRHLKKIIDSKEFGEAKVAHANFGYPHEDNWRCLERGESPLTLYALYTVMFSHFVFGKKAKKITATGAKDKFGTDNWATLVLEFDDDKRSVLYYDSHTYLPQSAWVSFEKGQVQIPEFFWCPEKILVVNGPMLADNKNKKLHEYPLNDDRFYHYNHSSGLRYEQDHVYELLKQGKLESDIMSPQDTLDVMGMLDEVRKQLGVEFPHDKK